MSIKNGFWEEPCMIVVATFNQKLKAYLDEHMTKISKELQLARSELIEVRLLDPKIKKPIMDDIDKQEIQILITSKMNQEQFNELPNLKGIIVPMTGLDGFDEAIINNSSIKILNAHSLASFVAERGLGIAMTLLGKIITQSQLLKEGIWMRGDESGKWTSLKNKKIGIYGYGAIGKSLVKMLKPFDPELYIINRHKEYDKELHLVKDLDELTKISDILFICVPANSETSHSISTKELDNMKDGFIINVGRGKVVDQKALFDALYNEELKGYGSDVWYNYPEKGNETTRPCDVALETFDNVVMTPHNSWNFDERKDLVEEEVVEHLIELVRALL